MFQSTLEQSNPPALELQRGADKTTAGFDSSVMRKPFAGGREPLRHSNGGEITTCRFLAAVRPFGAPEPSDASVMT
jgi:hypothetical protein